ncbi:MAG: metallophosphoesterase [Bacteroidota bacterium]
MNLSVLPAILVALLFLFLLDLYVFSGIKTLLAGLDSLTARGTFKAIFWILSLAKMGFFLFGISLFVGRDPSNYQMASLMFSLVIMLLVPAMVFALFMVVGDVFRLIEGLLSLIPALDTVDEGFLPKRRKFFSQIGLLAAGIPFVGIAYGILKGKYDFKVHRLTLTFPDLPEAFHGFTLAQISDIHSGSFDNPEAVQRGVDLVNEQKPDLIVFTGDLVNNYASEIEPWIDTFAQLKAPYGVYSVTGNHDYGEYGAWTSHEEREQNFVQLQENHKRMGFRLLMNEHVNLDKEGEQISLLGVENWGLPPFPQKGDLNRALRDSTDFKILLSHDPSHWDAQILPHASHIHLTLSGHTHGMQFGIEIPGIKWSPVKYRYPRWAGLYEKAQQYLYVNRGFGFIGFSGRVGIWPEITLITLEKA